MTPEKAIELLNELRRKITMTGDDHDLAREAVRVLTEFVHQNRVPVMVTPPTP